MTRKYAFFAVEGDADQIVVRQVLRNFLCMNLWNGKRETLRDIWLRESDVIPTYSSNTSGDVYKRANIPSLLYNDSLSVLLYEGGGSRLIKQVKATLDATGLHNELAAFAVFVDADNKDLCTRTKQYRDEFISYFPGFPGNPGDISLIDPGTSTGIYVFPNNRDEGVVEDLVLECGSIVYAAITDHARHYVDHFEVNLKGSMQWEPFGKQKAIVASVASLLKPGKSNLVTLKDNDWISESAKSSPMLQSLIDFCSQLLRTDISKALPV
jgi:hypothetical protein